MHRKKTLIGYETDLVRGVVFAKFRKEIIEDDGSITDDGLHRLTITSEDYDALKKLEFADVVALGHVKSIEDLGKQVEGIKTEKAELVKIYDDAIKLRDDAIALKDAEIATLKKK